MKPDQVGMQSSCVQKTMQHSRVAIGIAIVDYRQPQQTAGSHSIDCRYSYSRLQVAKIDCSSHGRLQVQPQQTADSHSIDYRQPQQTTGSRNRLQVAIVDYRQQQYRLQVAIVDCRQPYSRLQIRSNSRLQVAIVQSRVARPSSAQGVIASSI